MAKVLKLYKTGDFSENFQMIRIWDAPFDLIQKYLPKSGVVLDLGCGDGLLANYLAYTYKKLKVYGLDINSDRIRDAQKGIKNASFVAGDITKKSLPKADAILLAHVLHHLKNKKAQRSLLISCKEKLRKEGKLIIAEISERPIHKYLFTWLTDHITVPILFEKKIYNSEVFFRRNQEWLALLKDLGFKCRIVSAHRGKPFSHILLLCEK